MQTDIEEYYSLNNIARFMRSLTAYMIRMWWILFLSTFAGIMSGLLYYKIQKPKYEAVSTFILEEKSNGGGLAGLASQFGFDFGSLSGGGSIFAGDNILDILQSKTIVRSVLLSKVEGNTKDSSLTLADLFLKFSHWERDWSTIKELKDISYKRVSPNQNLTAQQDSVLNLIHTYILEKSLSAERANKKGTIIRVAVTSQNSLFAKLMTERLIEKASELYLNIKTGTAQANINRLQRRADSLWTLLNRKSYSAASSQLLDVNPGIVTATVPVEIASRDKTVIGTVYAEVTKNLEASKMLLSQQTPIIQILDKPSWPLVDKRKKLKALFMIGGAAGLCLAALILMVKFLVFVNARGRLNNKT